MVSESDYWELQQIIPGLPAHFATWQHGQRIKRDSWMASWRGVGEFVAFAPKDFKAWCTNNGYIPSEYLLENYVFEC